MRTPYAIALSAVALLLASCAGIPFLSPTATPVPPTPSPTPEPAAALVDGEPILLADFEAEIARYEAAQRSLGIDLATLGDYRAVVLNAMIDQRLLADAARSAGHSLESAEVEARIEALAVELGGSDAMGAWMAANGYSLEQLKASLAEELLAAITVQRLADEVPATAEQVHARHILVADPALAEELHGLLVNGADFDALAQTYSLDLSTRIVGGDLGWFSPGTLTTPEVEAAAFALQPGEIGAIVQSALGYHVIEVLERGDHALSPEAWRRARQEAVDDWLANQLSQAAVEIVITP
jgi:peptidyl-prolyl cis-trans isomerase C